LINSHSRREEESNCQEQNSNDPPEVVSFWTRIDILRVCRFNLFSRLEGANDDSHSDHHNRCNLEWPVSFIQDQHAHDHVGNQRASSEDHVQGHGNVEVEGVVVAHAYTKKHHNQFEVVEETNPRFFSSKPNKK
jgi:hypothetical protein